MEDSGQWCIGCSAQLMGLSFSTGLGQEARKASIEHIMAQKNITSYSLEKSKPSLSKIFETEGFIAGGLSKVFGN